MTQTFDDSIVQAIVADDWSVLARIDFSIDAALVGRVRNTDARDQLARQVADRFPDSGLAWEIARKISPSFS